MHFRLTVDLLFWLICSIRFAQARESCELAYSSGSCSSMVVVWLADAGTGQVNVPNCNGNDIALAGHCILSFFLCTLFLPNALSFCYLLGARCWSNQRKKKRISICATVLAPQWIVKDCTKVCCPCASLINCPNWSTSFESITDANWYRGRLWSPSHSPVPLAASSD